MGGEHGFCHPMGCNQEGCIAFERIYPEKYKS
jgi:hypothetical protein